MARQSYLKYFRFKTHHGKWYVIYKKAPGTEVPTGRSAAEFSEDEMVAWAFSKMDDKPVRRLTLNEFAVDFFIPEKCSWSKRMLGTGHSYGSQFFPTHRGRLTGKILPALGNKMVQDITPYMLQQLLLELKKSDGDPCGMSEKKHMRSFLMKIFDEARCKNVIQSNPVKATSDFIEAEQEKDIFEPEELRKLFPEDRRELMYIWQSKMWIAYNLTRFICGLRPSEASALSWGNDSKTVL